MSKTFYVLKKIFFFAVFAGMVAVGILTNTSAILLTVLTPFMAAVALSCVEKSWAQVGAYAGAILLSAIFMSSNFLTVLPLIFTGVSLIFLVLELTCSAKELNPSQDKRVIVLKQWQELRTQGLITDAEFEEKRAQILKIKR